MYALLAALLLAASLVYCRAMRSGDWRSWALFAVLAAAAQYAHNLAFVSLVPLAMTSLAARRRRAVAATVIAGLGAALLYLPWLPAMLNRYAVDRSYWQGALKINEALRHVAISFTTGAPETMLERDAVRLLPWFGVALVVAAGALMWRTVRGGGGVGVAAASRATTPPRISSRPRCARRSATT